MTKAQLLTTLSLEDLKMLDAKTPRIFEFHGYLPSGRWERMLKIIRILRAIRRNRGDNVKFHVTNFSVGGDTFTIGPSGFNKGAWNFGLTDNLVREVAMLSQGQTLWTYCAVDDWDSMGVRINPDLFIVQSWEIDPGL